MRIHHPELARLLKLGRIVRLHKAGIIDDECFEMLVRDWIAKKGFSR